MSAHGRIIDLSMAAAKKLNFVRAGLAQVTIEKIEK
jgi:rare lipoprotein A (peptidoglycan hydrolase)